MKNTRRIIAALAAVGTMALGTAFAAPAAPAPQPQPPQVTAPYYQGYAAPIRFLWELAELEEVTPMGKAAGKIDAADAAEADDASEEDDEE